MTKEQRAEALMRQGPIRNVRRIMELEGNPAEWLLSDEMISTVSFSIWRRSCEINESLGYAPSAPLPSPRDKALARAALASVVEQTL